jgi:group I intron endonuclease
MIPINSNISYTFVKYGSFPCYNILFQNNTEKNSHIKFISLDERLITEPVFVYNELYNERDNIKNDFKGFAGIYMWFNKINGKCYIGSGVNLYRRVSNYYQAVHLKRSYPIIAAINKYGLNSFNLVILELLGKSENDSRSARLVKEDYYLSTYLPEYNILAKGSSSLNYKHSVEVREKLRAKALKRDKNTIVYSKEFLLQQKSNKFGINNPMFGTKWTDEKRIKIAKPIYVYDSNTLNLLNYYTETIKVLKDLKMSHHTLKRCLLTNESFKGKIFSRIPITKKDI